MADDLNEVIEEVIDDASVITVPIDDTLSNSGEAADAKAVGDALALKADKSEIQTSITVNGQSADAQGSIIVTAADTQISDTDQTTVKAAIEAVDGKTAEDIPVSSSSSQTIKQALDTGATRTADQIPMSGTDSTTVKTHIDSLTGDVSDLDDEVSALEGRTAADILYNTGSQETIKQHVDAIETGAVKTVNEISPDEDGNIQIERVAYADNLYSEDQENVTDSFLIRTTAGSGSLSDGNAWAQVIRGNRTHPDFVPESLQMTVNAMPRPTPPAITATLNEATFEAYVEEAGTYTVSYDGTAWDADPTLYGLTISNTPVDGDVITMVWDGENDAVVSITAGPRTAPPAITATIDRDTFVSYVTQSGTTTLTYTTAWSADPEDYGITVTNDPIAGDQIVVVYVKEVRGTITVGHPTALVATGWNLYNHTAGYARVVRYSDTYGYLIQGAYSTLKFATTPSGTQTTITPDSSGLFNVPSDGYVIVTGGNNTTTAIICTWSDWTSGPSVSWEAYTESGVSLSSIMTADFPYGLCKIVQDTVEVFDEIDFVHKEAISRITRLEYTAENLATVKAAGRPYEYDEDYIYQERASYVVTSISVDEEYQVSEHGLEWFADSAIELYSEILYGTNLKDKLKRDVVTLSEQTLTSGQQAQVRTNIGAGSAADVSSNSTAIANLGSKYFALAEGTLIPDSTNFNEIKTFGTYCVKTYASAITMTNMPVQSIGTLYVKNATLVSDSIYFQQIYITYDSKVFLRNSVDSGNTWNSWQELATKSVVPIITRKTSNHSSSTTNSSGYVELDTYSSLGVDTSLYCIGMIIRGWTGSNLGMTVTKGSNGTTFYLTGPASTTLTGFTVEYYFVNLVS